MSIVLSVKSSLSPNSYAIWQKSDNLAHQIRIWFNWAIMTILPMDWLFWSATFMFVSNCDQELTTLHLWQAHKHLIASSRCQRVWTLDFSCCTLICYTSGLSPSAVIATCSILKPVLQQLWSSWLLNGPFTYQIVPYGLQYLHSSHLQYSGIGAFEAWLSALLPHLSVWFLQTPAWLGQ